MKPQLFLCPTGLSLWDRIKRDKQLEDTEKIGNAVRDFLANAQESELMEKSAELNSLFKMKVAENDSVVLLSSDTDECEKVSSLLVKFMEQRNGCKAWVKRIKGLQTIDKTKFDTEGVTNLTETIVDEIENRRYQYDIVLNATAGFKAVVPYLTIIGMTFGLPIYYLFEKSPNIIELPPMPIEFDMDRLKMLEPVINKLVSDYMPTDEFRNKTGLSYEDLQDYLKDILLEEDGLVALRPTGRILYKRYLQTKGYKIYLSPEVTIKIAPGGQFDSNIFKNLFIKMRDPVHTNSKLHSEVKKKGKVDLECYKGGATNERIFFYIEEKKIYICDIFMHDEYERRAIESGGLLRAKFENKKFEEFRCDSN